MKSIDYPRGVPPWDKQYGAHFILYLYLFYHQSSIITHHSSIISHQSSVINHQLSIINHPWSMINHQSSITSHHFFDIKKTHLTNKKERAQTVIPGGTKTNESFWKSQDDVKKSIIRFPSFGENDRPTDDRPVGRPAGRPAGRSAGRPAGWPTTDDFLTVSTFLLHYNAVVMVKVVSPEKTIFLTVPTTLMF